MSYTPPQTPNIIFDFSNEPAYTPPLSGDIEFSWGNILASFTWVGNNRSYEILLSWGSVSDATRYQYTLTRNQAVVAQSNVAVLTGIIKDAAFATTYGVKVEALNAAGEVIDTKETAITTPDPVPVSVSTITVVPQAESAEVSWPAVNYASYYVCTLSKEGIDVEEQTVNTPGITFTGLINASDYTVSVVVHNAVGESLAKQESFTTLFLLPDVVTDISQEGEYTLSVLPKWSLPTNTAVRQVNVQSRKAGAVFYDQTFSGQRTQASIRVEVSDTGCDVRVRTGNPAGWSEWSEWFGLSAEGLVEPDAVLGLLAGAMQPEYQTPKEWVGSNTGDRGIIEELGISSGFVMDAYGEETTSNLPFSNNLGKPGKSVSSILIGTSLGISSQEKEVKVIIKDLNFLGINVIEKVGTGNIGKDQEVNTKSLCSINTDLSISSSPKLSEGKSSSHFELSITPNLLIKSEVV